MKKSLDLQSMQNFFMPSVQNTQSRLNLLEAWPAWRHWLNSLLALGFITGMDHLTGLDIHLFIFYAIPIAYASWFLGRRHGTVLAILATLLFWFINYHGQIQKIHILILFWNTAVRLLFFLVVSQALGTLKKSYEYLQKWAETDILTGLKNRRVFFEQLDLAMARSQRAQVPLSLAYIDLDHFKQVNDTLGHAVGDELLQKVAEIMDHTLRKTDLIARLGGDEFALVLEGNQADQALHALERLQSNLLTAMREKAWPVTFSIGLVTFQEIPEQAQSLLHKADQLMYEVKRSGRGRISAEVLPIREAQAVEITS